MGGPNNLAELIGTLIQFMNQAYLVVVLGAVAAFFWGLAQFILHAGNEEKRREGHRYIFISLIVLFVIISIYSLVAIISSTFFDSSTVGPGHL